MTKMNIVGPVCESADFFAQDRMPELRAGYLLAIMSTGAYGFCHGIELQFKTCFGRGSGARPQSRTV